MATESKSPLKETVMGMGAVNGAGRAQRKRPSSLLAVASTLPSVENSLEEFIAKANQTLVDVGNWGTDQVKQAADAEDAKRKELDALRWKAAETQLKEGEARESSLRRQLDGLQGKLAEAEARAAVAADSSGTDISMNDTVISELRAQIADAQDKAAAADKRARTATEELSRVSRPSMEMPAMSSGPVVVDEGAGERARVAEAKAAKALAAARAIQAGLNVSSADLAAIESGLVVPELAQPKKFPWLVVAGAFVVGIALTFGIIKMTAKSSDPAPVAAAAPAPAAVAPAPAPAPTPAAAAPVKPIVTPIEEAPAPAPAPVEAAAPHPSATATPIETAPVEKAPAPVVEKAPAPVEKAPAPVHHAAAPAPQQHAAAPAKAPAKAAAKPASKIDDPFADAPAPKKAPAAPAKKPAAGSIADPF